MSQIEQTSHDQYHVSQNGEIIHSVEKQHAMMNKMLSLINDCHDKIHRDYENHKSNLAKILYSNIKCTVNPVLLAAPLIKAAPRLLT